MIKRVLKFLPNWITMFLLVIGTTTLVVAIIVHIMVYVMTRPRPISDSTFVSNFAIVAMNGSEPVEMIHERSVQVKDYFRLNIHSGNVNEDTMKSNIELPIVWANTGKANGSFRYYLTHADLVIVNSMLDSGLDEYPHQVRVRILEDDPGTKYQILQVTISGDESDSISVYQVDNDHICPLKWTCFRYRTVGFCLMLLVPLVLTVSALCWNCILNSQHSRHTTTI